jgi:hypothetical protein
MTCRLCRFPGSDLRLAGCGCTIHAVSSEKKETLDEEVFTRCPKPALYSNLITASGSENTLYSLALLSETSRLSTFHLISTSVPPEVRGTS